MIEITDLFYTYAPDKPALEGICLRVNTAERVALVGPNGAGKTTLLLHLNGILRGRGRVKVNGQLIDEKNLRVIRSMVGMVFQSPDDQLFSASVYEDVAYGLVYQGLEKDAIEERVKSTLDAVGLTGLEKRAPYHLSLGEKKRAALASVLSMQPQILVMDEPTAGLDPRGRRELVGLLDSLPQTMIAATHDMALVEALFSRLIILDRGRIVYDDGVSQALKNRELLENHGLI